MIHAAHAHHVLRETTPAPPADPDLPEGQKSKPREASARRGQLSTWRPVILG
jgi:hypothetical protein